MIVDWDTNALQGHKKGIEAWVATRPILTLERPREPWVCQSNWTGAWVLPTWTSLSIDISALGETTDYHRAYTLTILRLYIYCIL